MHRVKALKVRTRVKARKPFANMNRHAKRGLFAKGNFKFKLR